VPSSIPKRSKTLHDDFGGLKKAVTLPTATPDVLGNSYNKQYGSKFSKTAAVEEGNANHSDIKVELDEIKYLNAKHFSVF